MNHWKHFFWIVFFLGLCSCSAVYSTEPVGETPLQISAQDWDGAWLNKETFLITRVTDATNGVFRVTWIEPAAEKDRLESYEVQLRQSGIRLFGNVKTNDKSGKTLYLWGLVKRDGNQLICWLPKIDEFRALCTAGRLSCREQGENVILTALTPEHIELINSESESRIYELRNPLVFIRLTAHGG